MQVRLVMVFIKPRCALGSGWCPMEGETASSGIHQYPKLSLASGRSKKETQERVIKNTSGLNMSKIRIREDETPIGKHLWSKNWTRVKCYKHISHAAFPIFRHLAFSSNILLSHLFPPLSEPKIKQELKSINGDTTLASSLSCHSTLDWDSVCPDGHARGPFAMFPCPPHPSLFSFFYSFQECKD